MDRVGVSISTFLKNEALRGILGSLDKFGGDDLVVHVADDANAFAQPVIDSWNKYPVSYTTGPRAGIAVNKNRGIHWFLNSKEAKDCEWLCLSDDDLIYTSEPPYNLAQAAITACKQTGLKHLTGYIGEYPDNPFFKEFPPVAQNKYVYYSYGTQGIFLFTHRSLLERVMYMNHPWPSPYGLEHAAWSRRLLAMEGRCPDLFPILRNCERYFHCANIPNNYVADANPNGPMYEKLRQEIDRGVNLRVKNPGF